MLIIKTSKEMHFPDPNTNNIKLLCAKSQTTSEKRKPHSKLNTNKLKQIH